MVTLNHVKAHGDGVVVNPEPDVRELLELVDVIAVGFGEAAIGPAVFALAQPHHLGLRAGPQVEPGLGLELGVDASEVASTVGGQEHAAVGDKEIF